MKKLLRYLFIFFIAFTSISKAQIEKTLIGSSWNMYTVLSPRTNPVHVNNSLGTISFTHRQNSGFPGGSGVIQTTWSEDGGFTWGNYVLQPTNDITQFNRYPSGLILDPTGNNDMANAHTVVAGPTSSSGASGWVGNYFHNFALDGSGGREFLLYDADTEFPSFTRNSMMADENNTVRVLGYEENDLIISTGVYDAEGQSYLTDLVYAATASYYVGETVDANGTVTTLAAWGPAEPLNLGDTVFYMTSENYDLFDDGTINDTWTNEIEIINNYDANGVLLATPDTLLVWNNVRNVQDSEGNWLPDTLPYDSFYVELNGSVDSTYIEGTPGYYWTQKGLTSDGLVEYYDHSMAFNQNGNIGYVVHQGTDANGQILPFVHYSSDGGETWTQLDHDFSVIEAYITPEYNGGIDCAVDINGDLHMISSIFEGDASITETNRKLYDIVVNPNEWSADLISLINTEKVLDTDPMAIHGIGYDHRIQASRSSDGSKVFAVWTDVNLEEFGEDIEKIEFPDIYAFGKDVQTGMVTGVTNFTKWTQVEGMCYWMFTSPVTYDTSDEFRLPSTISKAGNHELDGMEHFYINGISFGIEDFNIIPIYGCTDINYFEYNSIATIDDGSCQVDRTPACQYEEFVEYIPNWLFYDNSACITLSVLGCVDDGTAFTDNINNYTFESGSDGIDDDWKYDIDGDGLQAFNYNPLATYNDSSCYPVIVGCFDSNYYNFNDFDYDGQPNLITGDVFSDINTNNAELCVPYYYGCTDLFACNFNDYANTDNGSCVYGAENVFLNNVQNEYNLSSNDLFTYFQQGTTTLNSSSLFIQGTNLFTQGTDLLFYATTNTLEFIESSLSSLFSYFDNNYEFYDCSSCINDLDSDGICDELEINGCTIPNADNYNNLATEDDGNCIYFGCMNGAADNYDSNANTDDGSCIYFGCTNETADNYDSNANTDDESCLFTSLIYDNIVLQTSIVQDSLINLQQTIEYFNTTIYLDEGWNLFGYGCPEPHEVTETLSSFTDIVIITKDNNGNVYMPQFNFNGIGSLSPGYGYQIKLSESIKQFKVCDWYFNEFIGK